MTANQSTIAMDTNDHRTWLLAFAGLLACLSMAAVLLVSAERAEAVAPIYAFDVDTSSTKAGGHPDIALLTEFGTNATEEIADCFCNVIRDIVVNTPAGLVAAPANTPKCKATELADGVCPSDSQIGLVSVRLFAPLDQGGLYSVQPLYNMEERPGDLALWATIAPIVQTPIYTVISARTESDYGIEFNTFGIPRLIPPNEIGIFSWGVPASSEHDSKRWGRDQASKTSNCSVSPLPELYAGDFPSVCTGFNAPQGAEATTPPTPYVLNPTTCVGPTTATFDAYSYDQEVDHAEDQYPATTGCDQLSFDPTLSAQPTTTEADSPSGVSVNLEVPQTLSAEAPSPSRIKATNVTFPEGFTINSGAANGKSSCSAAQARFGTRDQAQCPEFSKIGSLELESSSLPGVLPGAIYLGEPLPGERYRVFLVADGFSLHIKLAGTARPDPDTGRLTISFEDLPQTPFQRFGLHFFGAERGLLATPTQCGSYAVESEFVPWASELPNQTSTQFFEIDSGPGGGPCPPSERPFDPDVTAGVTTTTGGAHTTFVFQVNRDDGHQNMSSIDVTTAPGFSGKLTGIPYCSESELDDAESGSGRTEQMSPSCPSASQIGDASASAGPGTRPVDLAGKVYLAGPYKGAPLSLAVITPAVSGPYDLGNVVVRAALHVDPVTAEITAESDPLPQILEGIPLRLREVLVVLNRDEFALNPTNCLPHSVDTEISGDQGAVSNESEHFQVANCGTLDFVPRLGIRLRGQSNRNGHPSLQAVLRFLEEGQANIRRAAVTLPRTTLLDQGNLNNICTRAQYAADNCPANSIYGRGAAFSPLLDEALRGPVYLRGNGGARQLPDLVVRLRGQIDVELVGFIDSVRGRLRTIFQGTPDVPVDKFVLRMQGGARKGLVANSVDLCRNTARVRSVMRGQNGRRQVTRPVLRANCGKAGKRAKAKQRRAGVSLARKAG